MKIREGVSQSSWAGECGESFFDVKDERFKRFIKDVEAEVEKNGRSRSLDTGDYLDCSWSGTDPDSFEVTEIIINLDEDKGLRRDWRHDGCDGEGCAGCNDGWRHGEDRFVVVHNDVPYLCLTRYYEVLED